MSSTMMIMIMIQIIEMMTIMTLIQNYDKTMIV